MDEPLAAVELPYSRDARQRVMNRVAGNVFLYLDALEKANARRSAGVDPAAERKAYLDAIHQGVADAREYAQRFADHLREQVETLGVVPVTNPFSAEQVAYWGCFFGPLAEPRQGIPPNDAWPRLREDFAAERAKFGLFMQAAKEAAVCAITQDVREQPTADPKPVKVKRSTVKGEARKKLIAALTKHHDYASESCLNLEPIGNNELARRAKCSVGSASRFLNEEFGGWEHYRVKCQCAVSLADALKLLNAEFTPRDLSRRFREAAEAILNENGDD